MFSQHNIIFHTVYWSYVNFTLPMNICINIHLLIVHKIILINNTACRIYKLSYNKHEINSFFFTRSIYKLISIIAQFHKALKNEIFSSDFSCFKQM